MAAGTDSAGSTDRAGGTGATCRANSTRVAGSELGADGRDGSADGGGSAANVCRISDLPDLYSHFGSRGINVVTLLRSYRERLLPADRIRSAAQAEAQAITERAAGKETIR
ncbi:hypothetical protein [Streptomyces eurythermus]|uniref:hypothetical protein n=1 Tax=Streptomyces eurythermus TaxID=42237 RepID=UPI003F4CC678